MCDRKLIVLTPIEVSIEDIQLKVAKLDAAIKVRNFYYSLRQRCGSGSEPFGRIRIRSQCPILDPDPTI